MRFCLYIRVQALLYLLSNRGKIETHYKGGAITRDFLFVHTCEGITIPTEQYVTFRRNVECVEAFWNSYRGLQNVELSTGKRDPSTVKSVVPRDLLSHRRTLRHRARARSIAV